jgi:nucleotide-binding universal stress UspA family protein
VLISYDGSERAAEAIEPAAAMLPGERAIVVTVWRPIRDAILAVSLGPAPLISDPVEADERQRRDAVGVARDGARRAERAGFDAEPLAVKARGPIWEEIAKVAEDRDARLIVCGTHETGLKSTVLDNVPTGLVHHATRPVMVVPSSEAAAERERELFEE